VKTEQNRIIYAVIISSPGSPAEVYSASQACSDLKIHYMSSLTQLSCQNLSISNRKIGVAQEFYCTSSLDNRKLNGVFFKPNSATLETPSLPTLVFIHGGPYYRDTLDFDPSDHRWVPYLLSAGYGILCTNYRGTSGHGEEGAAAARGAMGIKDYSDVIDIVKAAISKRLVHPEKVVVAGWSYGGFLSCTTAVRDDFRFKGVISLAGITDMDMMCMTGDLPWAVSTAMGGSHWLTGPEHVYGRRVSPLWHMKGKKRDSRMPLLLLHGEADQRVPVGQAVAFHHACLELEWPCELVIYPREGHAIEERAHVLDMLKRVRRFCDLHLS
jgi:dipeptidyl aminopeptidase/acylaminoacyl peptidase